MDQQTGDLVDSVLGVNAPSVAGEVIDGEAVIMNLTTGHYFSTQGSGATAWEAISAGASRAQIAATLQRHYAVADDEVVQAVDTFVAELLRYNLVVETPAHDHPPVSPAPIAPEDGSLAPFHPLVLHVYTDMDDLLLLDPIHDVNDEGWPTPKASPASS
jgi:hypothetical protein